MSYPLRDSDADEVSIIRDVILCQLRAGGRSWRVIANVLGSRESTVRSHYSTIDPEVREMFVRTPLKF